MAVEQCILYERAFRKDPLVPFGAVATDGTQVTTLFTTSTLDSVKNGIVDDFTAKLAVWDTEDDGRWNGLLDYLVHNLIFPSSRRAQYDTFEQAQAAAQEALNG